MEEQWFGKIMTPRGNEEHIAPLIESGKRFFICGICCSAAVACCVFFW